MNPRLKRWMTGLTMACAMWACGDRALTTPGLVDPAPAALSRSGDGVVRLLKRTNRLSNGLSASAVIGPRGGMLHLPGAGVRIEFPRGAVRAPVRITVTALRGRNVAYLFEPHGIVFDKPVSIRQSLRNTTAWRDPAFAAALQGSYFERLLVDPSESYARSLEHRPASLRESGRVLEFTIEHFSGYMVSTGKVQVEIPVDVDITAR